VNSATASPHKWLTTRNRSWYLFALAYGLILLGRLYLTTQPPLNSTDLLRYLGYGREFWRYGFTIYNYTPRDFGDAPYSNIWPDLHFIYPGVAMLFFAGVAAIWPSLFFARLLLTLLELLNGLLLTRITGSRLYGLLYFLNPVSIWWTSGEGQYEGLVAFLTLLALASVAGHPRAEQLDKNRGESPRAPLRFPNFGDAAHPTWSYVWLGLAIQAKYWPGVLLPYFLYRIRGVRPLAAFVLSFIPSLLFTLSSVYIFHLIGSEEMAVNCNPFAWNWNDDTLTCWTPRWHLLLNAAATYGILGVILVGAYLERRNPEQLLVYGGLLAFVIYYKSINWATAWYLPMFGVFAAPVRRPWVRWAILLLSFAEPIAWAGLFGAPISWLNPEPPVPYIWGGL
jgi:hypothetical protein